MYSRGDLRWYPVVANGLAHVSMHDDVYEGMTVPAGSVIFANARYVHLQGFLVTSLKIVRVHRAMTLDETKFREPQNFTPERFLPEPQGWGEVLPESVVFGWGVGECLAREFL